MLDSASAAADTLTVSVTVAGGTATVTNLTHVPGQTGGTVEVDFPKGYPQGQTVIVSLVASRAGATVGTGTMSRLLSGGCETVSVSVTAGGNDGGAGQGGNGGSGNGGTGGGTGNGGTGGGTAGTGGGATGGSGGTNAGGSSGGGTNGGAGGAGAGGTGGSVGGGGVAGRGGAGGSVGGGGAGGSVGGGGAGAAGGRGGTGGTGGAGCPSGQTLCGGTCYPTVTDRAHCGTTCSVCTATQVCNSGCIAAPTPTFVTVPPDPAGWQDPNGTALTLTMTSTGLSNAIYECRTGPDGAFSPTSPPWGPCDGGNGSRPTHTPTPLASTPEGNYRTEYRYRADTYTSAAIATRYYVHHSLDRVQFCPRPGITADGPHFTDAQYFAAAQTFATANPTLFPVTGTFPAPGAIPARTDSIYVRNPFIKIPFVGITESMGMYSGNGTGLPTSWPATGGSYLLNERSLRHAWVLNPARTMILMKRRYIHPSNHCRNEIRVGHLYFGFPSHLMDCEALVVNANGNGLCLGTNGSAPVPLVLESPAANGPGTLTATVNSASVSGVGTSFGSATGGLVNQFIQIPAGSGRWYKISGVASAIAITITPVYAGTSASGMPYKISSTNTFNIPTGFAKMHPDAHNYATGVTPPGTPSPKTKCETPGCNTNKPWLIYLPP